LHPRGFLQIGYSFTISNTKEKMLEFLIREGGQLATRIGETLANTSIWQRYRTTLP
jgi:hypothetical protein